ncbi:MAG: hypothetical protein BGN91_03875 [Nitrobacter sp. 62-13]|nr:MAG: hypothetical protein BGN91_03875 [Nitrobacter sp. 62-13]
MNRAQNLKPRFRWKSKEAPQFRSDALFLHAASVLGQATEDARKPSKSASRYIRGDHGAFRFLRMKRRHRLAGAAMISG